MNDKKPDGAFLRFWKHVPIKSGQDILIVLKGHLLIEDLMLDYLAKQTRNPKMLEGARLGYEKLTYLTKAFQKYKPEDWLWPAIKKINALRNDFSHILESGKYESKRDELIEFVRPYAGDLYHVFHEPSEHLAVAIFVVYSHLSINLSLDKRLEERRAKDHISMELKARDELGHLEP